MSDDFIWSHQLYVLDDGYAHHVDLSLFSDCVIVNTVCGQMLGKVHEFSCNPYLGECPECHRYDMMRELGD